MLQLPVCIHRNIMRLLIGERERGGEWIDISDIFVYRSNVEDLTFGKIWH